MPMQKMNFNIHLTPWRKINSKAITYIRLTTIKPLEENVENICDNGLDKEFLAKTPKTQFMEGKMDKLDFLELKHFVLQKTLIKE